jgi:hypothetical protein
MVVRRRIAGRVGGRGARAPRPPAGVNAAGIEESSARRDTPGADRGVGAGAETLNRVSRQSPGAVAATPRAWRPAGMTSRAEREAGIGLGSGRGFANGAAGARSPARASVGGGKAPPQIPLYGNVK